MNENINALQPNFQRVSEAPDIHCGISCKEALDVDLGLTKAFPKSVQDR